MAAALTAVIILLFFGNWRLTLIILASIPLSIITAIIALYAGCQTLEHHDPRRFRARRWHLGRQWHGCHREHRTARRVGPAVNAAITTGPEKSALRPCCRRSPSPSSLCHIFASGDGQYLSRPCRFPSVSLMASLCLSFTLVSVLFNYLMRSIFRAPQGRGAYAPTLSRRKNPDRDSSRL